MRAASLPYGQGRFSMLLVMPDPSVSLSSFVAGMTADSVTQWAAQLQPGYGTLGYARCLLHQPAGELFGPRPRRLLLFIGTMMNPSQP